MKIKGVKIEGPNREIVVIPRGMTDDIVFVADAVLDMVPFDTMCPLPLPPKRKIKGVDVPNLKDDAYLQHVEDHAVKRMAWMVLTSLEGTEGLVWDTVDLGDPSTWIHFRSEMKDSGFSDMEINRVVAGVMSVNALSEGKIEAARERFLLSQQAQLNE